MKHHNHVHSFAHAHQSPASRRSLTRTAWSATLHCLSGCAIGEVLGMVIGTAFWWGNGATIVLSIVLAFFFGYLLTLRPLLRKMSFASAAALAFASDTASITVMEIVDNTVMLLIPGAMNAGLASALFWVGLALSLSRRCGHGRLSREPLAHLARPRARGRSRPSSLGRRVRDGSAV